MPQSLAEVWLHLVFSTRERRPLLQDDTFREEMFRMLSCHVKESKCVSASVGGHIDHVHLLVGLSRTITIAKLVEDFKTETSKWAKSVHGGTSVFARQSGYGVFSVSHSTRTEVDDYIRDQARQQDEKSVPSMMPHIKRSAGEGRPAKLLRMASPRRHKNHFGGLERPSCGKSSPGCRLSLSR